jgi:hypothetical protein
MIDETTKTRVCYALHTVLKEDPTITMEELFLLVKTLRKMKIRHKSSRLLIEKAFEDLILAGPLLYCNPGVEITLFEEEHKRPEENSLVYMPLVGRYSYALFSHQKENNLSYAEVVSPSFPGKVVLEGSITDDEKLYFDQWFSTPGTLESDPIPQWDDTDWKVYRAMRNPRRDITEASKELHIPEEMVEERFYKILKDCKVFVGFFPLGYSRYNLSLYTITTDYESGIKKFLQGLDRSSILLKVGNMLFLYLFYTHGNLVGRKLCEMQQMGFINRLDWSALVMREPRGLDEIFTFL